MNALFGPGGARESLLFSPAACSGSTTPTTETSCSAGSSTESCQTFTSSPGNREAQRTSATLSIYPNPAHDILTVEFDDRPSETVSGLNALSTADQRTFLYLIDLSGRVILQYPLLTGETRTELSVAGMAEGLYLIRLTDAAGKVK